jgi:hypothetical protein
MPGAGFETAISTFERPCFIISFVYLRVNLDRNLKVLYSVLFPSFHRQFKIPETAVNHLICVSILVLIPTLLFAVLCITTNLQMPQNVTARL